MGEEEAACRVRFGVLGCAEIFRKVGRAIGMAKGATIHALGSRSLEKAKAFSAENNLPSQMKLYGSYQEVIDDADVDVVYIPLPTTLHLEWVVKAAKNKKHVLLEKPPALTVEDMDKMIEACDHHGVQLMDGTMWVHHPRTSKMAELLHNPQLFGNLKEVHSVFSYAAPQEFLEKNIRLKPDLDALGAQGDIGWYCCRAILWANDYQMPQNVRAMPAPTFNAAGVIMSCGATFMWEDGRLATYHVSFLSHAAMNLIVQGTRGTLHVEDFCIPFEETKASFKFISDMKPKPLFLGWENRPEEHEVIPEVPQEVAMIEELSRIVKNIRDERGKNEPFWPSIMRKTQVLVNASAFDFSKVIESFVRHEETLPRELKRHLNALEERLLESLAWEKGSSMYNSLIVAKPCLAAEINRLGLLADPMPLLDMITSPYNPSLRGFQIAVSAQRFQTASDQDIAMPSSPPRQATSLPVTYNDTAVAISGSRNCFVSPSRSRPSAFSAFSTPNSKLQPPLQSAFASPHRPSPLKGGETCAETVINIFLQKVMKLAAIRIKNLCERLQLPNHIMGRVYRLIERILNHETSLFFNRHIDQLILCSLYGVSKVCCLNLTFKEIIVNYRKQPQCKPQVFRNIFIDGPTKNFCAKVGPKTVDIITFYNDVFIHSVKTFLLQLGDRDDASKNESQSGDVNQNDGPTPASPRPSPFVNLPDLSPKKISTMHNIYVSPLRSSKMESLNSPHSKSFYACVGESTHAFQSPSKDLTAINNHLNKNNPSQSPSQDLSAVNNHFNSRRVAGRINFDKPGLVSDSLVAGSLNSSQKCGHLISDSVSLGWTKSVSPLKRQRTDN